MLGLGDALFDLNIEQAYGSEGVTMAKYDPLHGHLMASAKPVVLMSFSDIERIIGTSLPASARIHSAWWANEAVGRHVQARAWIDAGYTTRSVDLSAQTVEFVRGPGADPKR